MNEIRPMRCARCGEQPHADVDRAAWMYKLRCSCCDYGVFSSESRRNVAVFEWNCLQKAKGGKPEEMKE